MVPSFEEEDPPLPDSLAVDKQRQSNKAGGGSPEWGGARNWLGRNWFGYFFRKKLNVYLGCLAVKVGRHLKRWVFWAYGCLA